MLLVVARAPSDPAALRRAAQVSGLALADVTRRLTGPPPRVLLVEASGLGFDRIAASLHEQGFVTFTCDPRTAPGDDARLVARRIELEAGGFSVRDGADRRHQCPWRAVGLVQRGVRIEVAAATGKVTERRLDVGRALLSGGLLLTKKVQSTPTRATEAREPFILVQREDGEPDVILYERRIDYRTLGAAMAASSHANLEIVATQLRAMVPAVPFDDTAARPGFVSGLPLTGTDPVDLALYLVALARRVLTAG